MKKTMNELSNVIVLYKMIGVLQNFGSTVYYVGVAPGKSKIRARNQVKVVEKSDESLS